MINDKDTCTCGAYWCSNGFCCAVHPRLNNKIKEDINEIKKKS